MVATPYPLRLLGKGGLSIGNVRKLLDPYLGSHQPAFLVLQVGGNDIGLLDLVKWRLSLEELILYLRARLPHTKIVWSDMLPRLSWRYCASQQGGENSRKKNQREARRIVFREGGTVIRHPNITLDDLYDGVHLNVEGMKKFIANFETHHWFS